MGWEVGISIALNTGVIIHTQWSVGDGEGFTKTSEYLEGNGYLEEGGGYLKGRSYSCTNIRESRS